MQWIQNTSKDIGSVYDEYRHTSKDIGSVYDEYRRAAEPSDPSRGLSTRSMNRLNAPPELAEGMRPSFCAGVSRGSAMGTRQMSQRRPFGQRWPNPLRSGAVLAVIAIVLAAVLAAVFVVQQPSSAPPASAAKPASSVASPSAGSLPHIVGPGEIACCLPPLRSSMATRSASKGAEFAWSASTHRKPASARAAPASASSASALPPNYAHSSPAAASCSGWCRAPAHQARRARRPATSAGRAATCSRGAAM